MNAVENDVRALVDKELAAANERFPQFHSAHEGYAVIQEEVDELKEDTNRINGRIACLWDMVRFNNSCDENPKNNCVDNLEWCDRIYNMNYGSCPKRISKNNSKPIFQVNIDGSIVKQYPSVIQASKETGIPSSTIYDCTRGARKKAWGYIWKYAN